MLVLIRYSEIGIKGSNRKYFEKKLQENIKQAAKGHYKTVTRFRGGLLLETKKKDKKTIKQLEQILQRVPGIANFSFCSAVKKDVNSIKKEVAKITKNIKAKPKSFRITTKRSDKSFPLTSQQMNIILASVVYKIRRMKVDLEKPELNIFADIEDKAFIYTEKKPGLGGLPVGSSGKVVCLLSGGIDSPVAAWKMMRRGCRVTFVHFHNYDFLKDEKISEIVKVLSGYQGKSKLYMVPFSRVQKEIIKSVPPELRFLVYRRFMFRIAEHIMEKESARCLVTGDSVGQVASQTLENLNVIYSSTEKPIFAPLIGTNKDDIIRLAQQISTYKISIVPYSDCCTFMTAKHPETKGNIIEIEKFEKRLAIKKLILQAVKKAEEKLI